MPAVTISVILEPKKIKSLTVSIDSSSTCYEVMEPDAVIIIVWMLSFKPAFSCSSITFIKKFFNSSWPLPLGWCHLHILDIYISPHNPDSSLCFIQPGFCMMYFTYKLNKQVDNIQPWLTPFPILNQSIVPCLVLTVASRPAYRFFRKQVRWCGIPISLRIFHSLLRSTQSKALV